MPLSYDDLANFYTQYLLNSRDPTEPPTFKANPKSGEGTATADELRHRQNLLDLLNRLYRAVKKIEDSNISDDDKTRKQEVMMNDYIKQGQEMIKEFISDMFNEGTDRAIDKLDKIGIAAKKPTIPSEAQTKLIAWQEFAIKKVGTIILLDLQNARLRNSYFEAAYGKPLEKVSSK